MESEVYWVWPLLATASLITPLTIFFIQYLCKRSLYNLLFCQRRTQAIYLYLSFININSRIRLINANQKFQNESTTSTRIRLINENPTHVHETDISWVRPIIKNELKLKPQSGDYHHCKRLASLPNSLSTNPSLVQTSKDYCPTKLVEILASSPNSFNWRLITKPDFRGLPPILYR